VLAFWSLDRLSREGTVQTLNHLQRLTAYGVDYRSFTEQYLDSTGIFKDAVIGILAAVAKQERVRLSERTIAGLERARSQDVLAVGQR
jgi:DNA invertase Pin-like site-specific DNA recombinase